MQALMRKQVANELQKPALLKRMLRGWKALPSVNRAEKVRQESAEMMRRELFGRRTINRLRNFIEWKRAHRGFFRLLLMSWHEMAAAQRQAVATASATRQRHDRISLTLHYDTRVCYRVLVWCAPSALPISLRWAVR